MSINAGELERICGLGWPGVESATVGDWWLRYGNGFTSRANSVLPLGSPGTDPKDAVAEVASWYADRRLRPIFQIPTGQSVAAEVSALDAQLASAGWTSGDTVAVLTGDITNALARSLDGSPDSNGMSVSIADRPGEQWLSLGRYRGSPMPPAAVAVMSAGPSPAFLSISRGDQLVGVARGVVTEGWLGVTAVTVAEQVRRAGIGTAVMMAALSWGAQSGAESAYLQVEPVNVPAMNMYARLGFTEHHGYHYLLAPKDLR